MPLRLARTDVKAQLLATTLAGMFVLATSCVQADSEAPPPPQYTNFGGVGLIETRSARMAPDATLSGTLAVSPNLQRYSVTFQATPWLEGTFNYNIFDIAPTGDERFDRQFDLKLRLLKESGYVPEVAIGLQDFLGTGLFSGEYIVASKRLGPLDLSLGIGWGRLGSTELVENPFRLIGEGFDNRAVRADDEGGEVNFGQFLQGEKVGIFGGVVYDTPIEGLRLIAEYDSDDKAPVIDFEDDIPFNFGVSYKPFNGLSLTGSVLHGTEFNITATAYTDVSKPLRDDPKDLEVTPFAVREGRGIDPLSQKAEPPVSPRPVTPINGGADALAIALQPRLSEEGLLLRRLVLSDNTLQISIENQEYRAVPKAVGRATRILTALAPLSVEKFRIIIVERGMKLSEFDIDREWIETSARGRGYTANPPPFLNTFHTADIGVLEGETVEADIFPRFSWSLNPDLRASTFDPDNPLRYNIDAVAEGSVEVTNGLFLSGAVRADIFGNFDDIERESDSVLPKVRSDFAKYYRETDVGVERLAIDYFFKPTDTISAKLSAGILEPNFGGVGGEVLYRPPQSSVAFGAELYYAQQRDFDTQFSFQDYDVVTGHISAYWDTPFYDIDLALHAGRYLAGDWGATLEATRRFANGWEVGVFATFTDVPFDEFGEGSFDKGLVFRIPFDWGLPYESKSNAKITLRPVQRDGGQRLVPGDRLFRLTQPSSSADVRKQWNDFSN